ncbi:50S ribosomal protein L24 [bioreactor metagenome]|uniref:Large ribosomal subunit protein uL24 n=2 Tax=root TaxID=1 RepID=A0AAN0MHU6_9ACTN|nr:50S ribosomal protein L24 [Brooklawnia sp. SH051]MEA5119744.1 50S ribosomal protein L24 [Propionibacterium sp.]NLI84123.1 50S ribosomal protein L24 [Propionibacterium sp.]BEH02909.1 50S ribosomal protein L24 [Brooklawnia sp. SH051]
MKLKKGDRVKVIAGKDKGAVGEIMAVYPDANRVLVQGVNIMKRHVRDQADPNTGRTTKGGVISSEAPIHASNVQLVTKDADGNEVLTRAGSQRVEVTKTRSDGSEYTRTRGVRIARKTGKEI